MIRRAVRGWLFAASMCALSLAPTRAFADSGEVDDRELLEWVDLRTGSASRLSSSCGHTFEAHLSGSPRENYLNLTVESDGETAASDFPSAAVAHFGSGVARRLSPKGYVASGRQAQRSWWRRGTFSFPSKAEFEHEKQLRIELSFDIPGQGVCSASIELVRRSDIEVPERSYVAFSRGAVGVGINVHFGATGDLHAIASNVNPGFDLSWFLFPWVHHGFGFEFGVDAYGGHGVPAIAPNQAGGAVVGVFAMLIYAYRLQLFERLSLQYDLGVGPYAFYVDSADGQDRLASTVCLGFREKLKLNILLSAKGGTRLELAPAFMHSYLPAGHLGAASVSGNLFGGALYLIMD